MVNKLWASTHDCHLMRDFYGVLVSKGIGLSERDSHALVYK